MTKKSNFKRQKKLMISYSNKYYIVEAVEYDDKLLVVREIDGIKSESSDDSSSFTG